MSDITLEIKMHEDSADSFMRCARKLLSNTFLLKEKDEKLYLFAARESNLLLLRDYFRLIGFDVRLDAANELVMLVNHEEVEELPGLKNANIVRFSTEEYHLLLILWESFLENVGYSEGNYISRGELVDKIRVYGAQLKERELSRAMETFRRYNLIDYDPADRSEDAQIRLYPSLQFGWELKQFQTIVREYGRESEATEESPSSGEEGMDAEPSAEEVFPEEEEDP